MSRLPGNYKYYLSFFVILTFCIIFYQWNFSSQDKKNQVSTLSNHIDIPGITNGIIKPETGPEEKSSVSEQKTNPSGSFTTTPLLTGTDSSYTQHKYSKSITASELWKPEPNALHLRNDLKEIEEEWHSKIKSPLLAEELTNVVFTGSSDVLSLVSNPVRWNSKDLFNLALVASGTLLLYSIDNQIHKAITNGGTPSDNELVKFGQFYGETKTTEYASLGIAAYGLILNDKNALKLGLELFESYFIADNITGTIKYAFGRSRPSENTGAYTFDMFHRPERLSAFPSGHTTLAFSMSAVLASITDDTNLKILIYIPAFLTGFSRIYENHHWASDVFLGAGIGYFVGSFVVSRHNPFRHDGIEFGIDEEGRPGIKVSF